MNSRPQQQDGEAVCDKTKRRRRRPNRQQPSPQPTQDAAAAPDTPAPEEPRVPPLSQHRPEILGYEPFNPELAGLTLNTSATPWTVFRRYILQYDLETVMNDAQRTPCLRYALFVVNHYATLMLGAGHNYNVDAAGRLLTESAEETPMLPAEEEDDDDEQVADWHQRSRLQRYRNTPRLVIVTLYFCEPCQYPSTFSLAFFKHTCCFYQRSATTSTITSSNHV